MLFYSVLAEGDFSSPHPLRAETEVPGSRKGHPEMDGRRFSPDGGGSFL
jgi:hypothetical protein